MDVRCQHLFAADNHGYIYHWDIKGYAMSGRETEPPPCKLSNRFYLNILLFTIYLKKNLSGKMLESSYTNYRLNRIH
jgi:hypothetical protein